MDKDVYTDDVFSVLRKHRAKNRDTASHPILIFACGGNPANHKSRHYLEEYVKNSEDPLLDNVFFLKAEDIAKEPSMKGFDLLTQEALVADIADWLVIFAESAGSFCELGAFSALPSSLSLTSVVIQKKYRGGDSFLINGPARMIEECGAVLSRVFYSRKDCPMENPDFVNCVINIRSFVMKNEDFSRNRGRKTINTSSNVMAGSFAMELLDFITLFGPIDEEDLIRLYMRTKQLETQPVIHSRILINDMGKETKIFPVQILEVMHATGLIGIIGNQKTSGPLYYSKINLTDYFMFRGTKDKDFLNMHAEVCLRKRRRGYPYAMDFYRRFDTE